MDLQIHIEEFSSTLRKILNRELELGNEIAETSKGWPSPDTIIIFLRKPFIDNYKLENVKYVSVEDPHYWKAEYVDHTTNHILACRF